MILMLLALLLVPVSVSAQEKVHVIHENVFETWTTSFESFNPINGREWKPESDLLTVHVDAFSKTAFTASFTLKSDLGDNASQINAFTQQRLANNWRQYAGEVKSFRMTEAFQLPLFTQINVGYAVATMDETYTLNGIPKSQFRMYRGLFVGGGFHLPAKVIHLQLDYNWHPRLKRMDIVDSGRPFFTTAHGHELSGSIRYSLLRFRGINLALAGSYRLANITTPWGNRSVPSQAVQIPEELKIHAFGFGGSVHFW